MRPQNDSHLCLCVCVVRFFNFRKSSKLNEKFFKKTQFPKFICGNPDFVFEHTINAFHKKFTKKNHTK